MQVYYFLITINIQEFPAFLRLGRLFSSAQFPIALVCNDTFVFLVLVLTFSETDHILKLISLKPHLTFLLTWILERPAQSWIFTCHLPLDLELVEKPYSKLLIFEIHSIWKTLIQWLVVTLYNSAWIGLANHMCERFCTLWSFDQEVQSAVLSYMYDM